MNMTKEDVVNAISKMNILEIIELTKMMEKKFNITTPVNSKTVQTEIINVEKKEEEKKFFDVVLNDFGVNKIAVIKAIRTVTNLGLKESKQLVDSLPSVVKTQLSEDSAKEMQSTLEKSGASVKLV